jgi:hypothetical protein
MPELAWSTPLPRPITIPKVMKLKTLYDVRKLIDHSRRAASITILATRRGHAPGLRSRRPQREHQRGVEAGTIGRESALRSE